MSRIEGFEELRPLLFAIAYRILGSVARVLASFPPLVRIGVVMEPRVVNGQPGAIFRDRDGKVLTTLALDVLDGQIQTIRAVINPDKLKHLGPVADGLGGRPRGAAGSPAHGLTARADYAPGLYEGSTATCRGGVARAVTSPIDALTAGNVT